MPEVSIIMPTHNRPDLTKQALESLVFGATDVDYELIVVDDASTDQATLDYLDTVPGRVIKMPAHTHHGACCNAGAAVASGDWLYFSDNDVFFTPNWLSRLMNHAYAFPEFGVLGADLHPIHPIIDLYERGELSAAASWTQVGYSMLITHEHFRQFGPFNHDPLTTYGQDDVALCNNVLRAGLRVGAVTPRLIYHCGITKTNGEPAIGAEAFLEQQQDAPKGVHYA